MKHLLILLILLFPIVCLSQSVNELFLQLPIESIRYSGNDIKSLITETNADRLKFRVSETKIGEFKLLGQKKDETIVGMTISDCNENALRFWKVKNGVWKDVTAELIKPLGKNDVINILKVSPVSISKLDQQPTIATFYEFAADSKKLKLIARKQDTCEIAGTVYTYNFNGKKFEILK